MSHLFSSLLCIDGVFALYFFFSHIFNKEKKDIESRFFCIFALASAIWSIGFGMLFVQQDVQKAYFWRSFAIFGTVSYMITSQFLICRISRIPKKTGIWLNAISCLGIPVYFLTIQPGQTKYIMSNFGMTYEFRPGLVNNLYTFYFILVAVNILGVIIYMMRFSPRKRIRVFGRSFLIVTILILLGTILDMIFPAIGLPALPGSNVTQFWGLLVLQYALEVIRKNKLNVTNMSEYVYYSISIPILIFDSHYHVQVSNEAANIYLNLPDDENLLYNTSVSQLFKDNTSTFFSFSEKSHSVDTICMSNDHPCNLNINKIKDAYGDILGYIVTITDLSEQTKHINELKKARTEADNSNAAKSQFLANMSHEIRTPMNAIIGFSELAMNEATSPTLREYINDIKNSSHHLMSLINDILDFSKIESGKMTLVDINYDTAQLFQVVYQIIHSQVIAKGLDFQVNLDTRIPRTLYGDVAKLRSVLLNLLNNAVKYTKAGFVKLDVTVNYIQDTELELTIQVSDSGIGMEAEALDKIFNEFTRVDQSKNYGQEGTGLGLPLAKEFCKMLGGEIKVRSIYGRGSVFTATVRQTVVDKEPATISLNSYEPAENEYSLGKIHFDNTTVLVVDDNPVNCKVISRSLEHYGLSCDIANNGDEAIKLCSKKNYPLIFMDQMMPIMDGIETMNRIRKLYPFYSENGAGKIVALTANAILGVREKLISLGFDEYLSKPINHRDLETILSKFLRYYLTENNAEPVLADKKESLLTSQLPNINVHTGMEHCGNDAEIYLEILALAYTSSPKQLDDMCKSWKEKNLKDFSIYAHALKGSFLNIGANEYGEFAKKMEFAGKEENTEYIENHLDEFKNTVASFLEEIRPVLLLHNLIDEGVSADTAGQEEQTTNSTFDFSEFSTNIRTALEDFNFARASEIVRDSLQKITENSSEHHKYIQLISDIEKALSDMDTDKILSILEQ